MKILNLSIFVKTMALFQFGVMSILAISPTAKAEIGDGSSFLCNQYKMYTVAALRTPHFDVALCSMSYDGARYYIGQDRSTKSKIKLRATDSQSGSNYVFKAKNGIYTYQATIPIGEGTATLSVFKNSSKILFETGKQFSFTP